MDPAPGRNADDGPPSPDTTARDAAASAWDAWLLHTAACQGSCLHGGIDCAAAEPLKERLLQARAAALAPSAGPTAQQPPAASGAP